MTRTKPPQGAIFDFYTRENPFTVEIETPKPKDTVEGADVTFKAIEHGLVAAYTLPEGYTPEGRLLNAKGGVVALMQGRIDRIVDGKTETFKFSGGATQNVKYTYEARVKKDQTTTTIKTLEFTLQGEK